MDLAQTIEGLDGTSSTTEQLEFISNQTDTTGLEESQINIADPTGGISTETLTGSKVQGENLTPQQQLESIAGKNTDRERFGQAALEIKKAFDTLPDDVKALFETQLGVAWANREKEPERLNQLLEEIKAENQKETNITTEQGNPSKGEEVITDQGDATTGNEEQEPPSLEDDDPNKGKLDQAPLVINQNQPPIETGPPQIDSQTKARNTINGITNLLTVDAGDRYKTRGLIHGLNKEIARRIQGNIPEDPNEQKALIIATIHDLLKLDPKNFKFSQTNDAYYKAGEALNVLTQFGRDLKELPPDELTSLFQKAGLKSDKPPRLLMDDLFQFMRNKQRANGHYLGIN